MIHTYTLIKVLASRTFCRQTDSKENLPTRWQDRTSSDMCIHLARC